MNNEKRRNSLKDKSYGAILNNFHYLGQPLFISDGSIFYD